MPIIFERPLALLLLPILVGAALYLSRRRLARGRRFRTALRAAASLAVALGLAGLAVGAPRRPLRVELVDASASFRARRPAGEAFLDAARPAATAAGAEVARFTFAESVVPFEPR